MLGLMGSHKAAWLQRHKRAEGTRESNVAFADTDAVHCQGSTHLLYWE